MKSYVLFSQGHFSCVCKNVFVFTTVQKLQKLIDIFYSYDHKCTVVHSVYKLLLSHNRSLTYFIIIQPEAILSSKMLEHCAIRAWRTAYHFAFCVTPAKACDLGTP